MDKKLLLQTTKRLLSVPTASFHEQWLQAAILKELNNFRAISSEFDRFGNLLLRYRPTKAKAKICFQAHLDHPGFVAVSREEAEVLGNIPINISGAKVRFFASPSGRGVEAKVVGDILRKDGREFVRVSTKDVIAPNSVGMWDLPAFRQAGGWLEGRSLDDNLCASALIYLLKWAAIKKTGSSFDVLLTRAEEVGYIGAWALLKHQTLKLPSTIINLEVPREYTGMTAGEGVVVRGADRNSFFDPELLNLLAGTCEELKAAEKTFRFQKGLGLLGGIEATSFQLHGYQVASLCVAVQNGHNVGAKTDGRPAPERASLIDLFSLTTLLERLITKKLDFPAVGKEFARRVESRFAIYAKDLKRGMA